MNLNNIFRRRFKPAVYLNNDFSQRMQIFFNKRMTSTFYSNLSENFYSLLNNADDSNVIIQVGKIPNTKEFHAHSNILRARSPYFKSAFSAGWINNMIEF